MMEALLSALAADPMGRLRWMVLRAFHVLPGSEADRQMTEEKLLRCGLYLLLETDSGPQAEAERSAAFDEGRFLALAKGGRGE